MKISSIHFVGIKGVGMTPLAIIAKEAGISVTGSDVADEFITDEQLLKTGIKPLIGFKKENIQDPDLVIYTGAHGGINNPEVIEAEKKGIECLNLGQALGKFQTGELIGKKLRGISVAGAHGKTTTTAILSTILKVNHKDPSFVVGTGEIPSLGKSGHFGSGEYFITESDEYFSDVVSDRKPKFLYQNPEIAIITNIDFDHPDIFKNYDEVEDAYLNFVKNIKSSGVLIMCGDGELNRRFLSKIDQKVITFGSSPENDFVLERTSINPDGMFFWINSGGSDLGQFSMKVFGAHNANNALAAIVASLEIGISVNDIRNALKEFKGAKRRMEFIGNLNTGAILYDDYAHHPEEIIQAISSLNKAYPKYKIIIIFQPHMYSRTIKLFDDFVRAFGEADELLMAEIFPSFREKKDKNFSSKNISDKLRENGKNSTYFSDIQDMLKYVASQKYDKNTIIVTMGAGDIYKIGKKIING